MSQSLMNQRSQDDDHDGEKPWVTRNTKPNDSVDGSEGKRRSHDNDRDGEKPWVPRNRKSNDPVDGSKDKQRMFKLPIFKDDEDVWVTRLVAEQFVDDLGKGNYTRAWKNLVSSKESEFSSDILKEQWEEHTKNKGRFKQRIGSKLVGQTVNGKIVHVTIKFENPDNEMDFIVTISKNMDEGYNRVFEWDFKM
ncbi:DUF3887 domain-containing protein [Leptolyngbyaceae cyanobacterium CCMR0082]|uniref:DUF3887 domain-containing protein n=2 Tax=Adonisia turfae TaxID=2950184 RepID=A0A6M0RYT3_9CYAN|nr:DUF3887 domain-containing protein [Adonisia turfae]MDV3347186.1 DUF3887 domain-containing protein [Leptothoe sp. LEGE 181152]NEZ59053.1 DUF3887 domain-containing protein [Adonisia turfae CCMR0081]NEZ61367.1 DUF3887 domain-containing protein [Adonisia turfae CCMR0082]